MRNKLLALLMAMALMLALASCGAGETSGEDVQESQDTQEETAQPEGDPEEMPEEAPAQEPEEEPAQEEDTEEEPAREEDTEEVPAEEAGDGTEKMTLSSTDFTLFSAGSSYQLQVTGAPGACTFASSDPKVATVAADGTVTAVAPGTAIIVVTSGSEKRTCAVRCNWKTEKPEEKPAEDGGAASTSVDLNAFYEDMISQYEFQSLQQFSADLVDAYYAGLNDVDTKQCLVMGTMMSMNNGEFCLVEVTDSKDVDTVKEIFQSRVDYMAETGAWYPGPTELWTNSSRVVSDGNYVMMVVHESCDAIVEAFQALI